MIRTVVIDDEDIIREGLKKLIQWEKMGFKLIRCATNGLEGIEIITKYKPDLAIVDIRMPGLDGLSMIKQLQERGNDLLFVIMSGYTDFEYAKRALKLGVIDYMEKPITIPQVKEMLEKIKSIYDERTQEKENTKKSQLLSHTELQKELLEMIYDEAPIDIYQRIKRLNENQEISEAKYFCIFKGTAKSQEGDFVSELESVLRETSIICKMITVGESFIGVLLLKDDGYKKADIRYFLDKAFRRYIKRNHELYIGVSSIVDGLENLRKIYLESVSALKYSEFMKILEVSFYEELKQKRPIVSYEVFDENLFLMNIRKNNEEQVKAQIKQYFKNLRENKIDPRIFIQEALRMVYRGEEAVVEKQKGYIINTSSGMLPHEELQAYTDYNQVENGVIEIFEQVFEKLRKGQEGDSHHAFSRAKEYLYQNFTEEISLEHLAEVAGMNTTYFSQLFKEKMGTSYIKYLTRLRVEYAKKLLKEGYKIREVSEKAGYLNPRYFCDLFKKHVGMTPKQYKMYKAPK